MKFALPADAPKWLHIAMDEVGVHEAPGPKDNPRILEYHASAPGPGRAHDEVPWCSAFVNWCLHGAGVRGTQSKAARSWERYGQRVDKPRLGSIMVFWRKTPKSAFGHVAFYLTETDTAYLVLGGNQDNSVSLKQYPKNRFVCSVEPDPKDYLLQ